MSLDLMDVHDIHYIVDVMEQYEGEWGIFELEDSQMAVSPRPVCFFPPPARISCFHRPGSPVPRVAYESYDEFESRVVTAQISLQAAIDAVLARIDPENLETAFCHVLIDAMCTNFFPKALRIVQQLTKGGSHKWVASLAEDIDTAVRFLTRVYVHTIAGYPEIPLALNFVQLRSMLTAECWEILTRSKPYGCVALHVPLLGYEGAAGELLAANFYRVTVDGHLAHFIPCALWPQCCVAFCMITHAALGASQPAGRMHSDLLRHILDAVMDPPPPPAGRAALVDAATQT